MNKLLQFTGIYLLSLVLFWVVMVCAFSWVLLVDQNWTIDGYILSWLKVTLITGGVAYLPLLFEYRHGTYFTNPDYDPPGE